MKYDSEKKSFDASLIKIHFIVFITLISILLSGFLSMTSFSASALDNETFFEANLEGEYYGIIGEKYVVYLTFENFAKDEFLGASAIIDYDASIFEIDSEYFDIISGFVVPENVNSETYPLIDSEKDWVFWGNNEIIDNKGRFYVNVLNDSSELTSLSGDFVSCFVEFKVKENASVSESVIKIDTDSDLVGVFSETLIESKNGTGSQISVSVVEALPVEGNVLTLKEESGFFMGYDEFSSIEIVYGFREKSTVSEVISAFKNSKASLSVIHNGKILNETDIIPTDAIIQLIQNNEIVDSKILVCKGDVDGSGEIDSTDYLIIKRYFIGNYNLKSSFLAAADIDCNSIIDTTDYIKIKSYFLGNIDIYA